MLTKEQVLAQIQAGRTTECLDARDYMRLAAWFELSELPMLGLELKDGTFADTREVKPWMREAFLEQLARDVAFGFEKALDRRGISSSLMFETVRLWLWILEDELFAQSDAEGFYAMYGLPLFKAVAVKYGFPNPIGDDEGSEDKYNDDEAIG